jgi:hypothetical protein
MNIWDSVHRSLEKASQEAARIAKTQRLRTNFDNLSRQIHTQHDNLIGKAMELYSSGELTQSELIPLCQELTNLQQQLHTVQSELKQLQSQGIPPAQSGQPATPIAPPPPGPLLVGSDAIAPTVYAPPPPEYQPYVDTTVPIPAPPPPPGGDPLTVSAIETVLLSANALPPAPTAEKQLCSTCQTEVAPGNAFCHNCGSPVRNSNTAHLPTMRGGTLEPLYPEGQETIRSSTRDEMPPGSISPSSISAQQLKDGGQ